MTTTGFVQGDLCRLSGFYSYGDNISIHRYHTIQLSEYNHGGLNITYPRFPQENIPRGVQRENLHKNRPYYSYLSMPAHPHPSMPSHLYPSIPPHATTYSSPYATSHFSNYFTTPSLFLSILNFYSYVYTLCSSTLYPYSTLRLSTYVS